MSDVINTAPLYMPASSEFAKARRYRMRLAWLVWFVSATFVLFQFFLQLSSGEIIAGLMKSFSLSTFGGGLLSSCYYYIYVLLQIPAGLLLDRYGARRVLSIGACVTALGCILFSLAKTLFLAWTGRILMGGGSAFAFVGCLNIISIWFPAKRFALMAAVVETAGMIGAILGNFFLSTCIETVGWRYCLTIAGIFAGFLSCGLFLMVRDAPQRKKIRLNVIDSSSLWCGLTALMRNPILWINGVYSGAMFSIISVLAALWAIPFFERVDHVTLIQATLMTSATYVGVAVGGPAIGWIDSRTRLRRPLMIVNAVLASVCLFFAIYATAYSIFVIAAALFLAGFCASSYVLTFAIANETAPTNRATAIGFTNTLSVIFAPILQPIIGFLMTYHFQWSMSVLPILLFSCGVMAFWLPVRSASV